MEHFWNSQVVQAGFCSGNNRYKVKITVPGPRGGKGVVLLSASIPAQSFDDAVDFGYHVIRQRTREEVSCG